MHQPPGDFTPRGYGNPLPALGQEKGCSQSDQPPPDYHYFLAGFGFPIKDIGSLDDIFTIRPGYIQGGGAGSQSS
jgi:hypothetical protein